MNQQFNDALFCPSCKSEDIWFNLSQEQPEYKCINCNAEFAKPIEERHAPVERVPGLGAWKSDGELLGLDIKSKRKPR